MKNKLTLVFIPILFITVSVFLFNRKVSNPIREISSTFLKFPDQFKWCVATSAHQIEGNNIHNDWWPWEK